jgi:hypothetical protein
MSLEVTAGGYRSPELKSGERQRERERERQKMLSAEAVQMNVR